MKQFLTILAALCLLTSCHDDDDRTYERIVMVYMANDNTGGFYLGQRSDVREMIEGTESLTRDQKVVAFIDNPNEKPYILEIAQGDTTRVHQFDESLNSSDATVMGDVLTWIVNRYKAESYGLVLWGHATGWEFTGVAASRGPRKAYAIEHSTTWMQIPDMARALSRLPKLAYIFADCCCLQCIEVDYELRNVADYIIASAAEIPSDGAPYQTVVPALFGTGNDFYKAIVDAYYAQSIYNYREPLSVVKTSELDDLAAATHTVLSTFLPASEMSYPDVSGLIYYYDRAFFDMNDFILRHASDNDYQEWRRAFDKAVVYKTMAKRWMANHVKFTFDVTEERYGGVSMFVPQDGNYNLFFDQLNKTISRMQWYSAARLNVFGW
ncbi:MAG: hypothetical protein II949_15280 [Prevotella sp.]|nr:hypothetical protein [Prevotella sp.]